MLAVHAELMSEGFPIGLDMHTFTPETYADSYVERRAFLDWWYHSALPYIRMWEPSVSWPLLSNRWRYAGVLSTRHRA